MRAWLAASTAVVALALCGIAAPAAHGADGDIDVRITAQRLADGRTEFALQQRQQGGEWGGPATPTPAILPRDHDDRTVARELAADDRRSVREHVRCDDGS